MKKYFIFLMLLMAIGISACAKPGETDDEFRVEDEQVAVADFQQMRLPVPLEDLEYYASNGKWFYIAKQGVGSESTAYQILRGKVESDYEGEVYQSREGAVCLALTADRENCCYVLWSDTGGVYLEKYDENGEVLWHADQDPAQWTDVERNNVGRRLSVKGGTVTTDGRLVLYTQGTDDLVALFDTTGNLLQMTAPDLEHLDGIAAGSEGRVYGYCITGKGDPVLTDIEDSDRRYVLPFRPLNVFGGYEEGIYLNTSEGLWVYSPATGIAEIKWAWADEYMNVDYRQLRDIYCEKQRWYLLCYTPDTLITGGMGKVTVVSVKNESGREYGPKETVTLGYADIGNAQSLERIVNLYNRQSLTYHVKLIAYGNEQSETMEKLSAFEQQLLKEDGPDLMEVSNIYTGNLADKDAFRDLSDYFAENDHVDENAVLDRIRSSMRYKGKDMFVIPSFSLYAQACKEPIAAEEWTPEKLIQLADEQEALWQFGTSAEWVFQDCLGRYAGYERYIDYDAKESHFDCSEFRWILKNCARFGGDVEYPMAIVSYSNEQPAYLYDYHIGNMTEYLWHSKNLKDLNCSWVGYPSWDGAVYLLIPGNVFAMNRKAENREGAWDFLQYILSKECQNEIDWEFPVREDSFERYLRSSYVSREDREKAMREGFLSVYYFDSDPTETDFDDIRYMVNHSITKRSGGPIGVILEEETGMYFAGDATLEETVRKIDNRVTLYLKE